METSGEPTADDTAECPGDAERQTTPEGLGAGERDVAGSQIGGLVALRAVKAIGQGLGLETLVDLELAAAHVVAPGAAEVEDPQAQTHGMLHQGKIEEIAG